MKLSTCAVINFKQYGSVAAINAAFDDGWLYIGRANRYAGLAQSPLANPFKAKDFGGRGQTLPHYRRWLWARTQTANGMGNGRFAFLGNRTGSGSYVAG